MLHYLLFELIEHGLVVARLKPDGTSENPSVPGKLDGTAKSGKVSLQPADPGYCGVKWHCHIIRQMMGHNASSREGGPCARVDVEFGNLRAQLRYDDVFNSNCNSVVFSRLGSIAEVSRVSLANTLL